MYNYFCTLVLLLSSAYSHAQPAITGTVEDSAHAALSYSAVALTDTTGEQIIKGTIADDNGLFTIALPAIGYYKIRVQHAGYVHYVSGIIAVDSTAQQMGTIVLHTTEYGLKEVAIRAQRPVIEFKDGHIIMNVENDLLANGNTVLELLKRLPGVTVDAQNNVTINGRGGIGFMMDGRLQQVPVAQMVNILSSMSAESIATIELIKNPSAKYDAAGTSGLINIISKKVKLRGISGNILESAGIGKRAGSVSAFSFNYKTNKLTLLTNTSYANKDVLIVSTMSRTLYTPSGNTILNIDGRSQLLTSVLNFKGGLEYQPTERTTIGINVTDAPNTSNEFIRQHTYIDGINPLGYNHLAANAHNPERYNNPSAGIYAMHVFDTVGTQLKFAADYTNFLDKYSGLNKNSFYNNTLEAAPMLAYNNIINLNFKIITQKLDFTKMLSKTIVLEAGEKSSFVQNDNNSSVEINEPGTEQYHTDTTYNNRYNYKEQIWAGYINLNKSLAKGSLQIGLRGEQTDIDAINRANNYAFQQHYFNLFPNASIDYALSQKNSLQFSYSYRIDRPAYNQLNPIKVFNDALSNSAGNPELKPQYSHKLNAEFSHGSQLHFSLAYTHTNNSIYNYSFTRPGTQISTDTSFNFAFSDQLVLGTYAQYQAANWYSVQAMGNAMYGNRRGIIDGTTTTNSTLAFQANMNNTFFLPKDYKLQVNANYTSAYKDGIQEYGQRGSVDIALQKKLLKGKLNTTLGIYDLFYTDYGYILSTLPGQASRYTMRQDTRRLRLTLNYRFGNMKIDRKVNESEVNTRIKKGS